MGFAFTCCDIVSMYRDFKINGGLENNDKQRQERAGYVHRRREMGHSETAQRSYALLDDGTLAANKHHTKKRRKKKKEKTVISVNYIFPQDAQ